jgi:hypothetical protein
MTSWTITLFLFLIGLKLQGDLLCEASTSDGHCNAWAVRRVHCQLTYHFFFFLCIALLDVTMDGYYSSELLSQSNRPIRLPSHSLCRRVVWAIRLYGVTYQNAIISISTATRTSHLIICLYLSSLGFSDPVIQISILGLVACLKISFKGVFWKVNHQNSAVTWLSVN